MTIVLFLPGDEAEPWRWWRLAEGGVAEQGEGVPDGAPGAPVVAVAPADAVALHWAELPDRSPAQAVAAARLLVAEASAAPATELHVAVGSEGASERPVGVVAAATMARWLARLASAGVDPAAVVPAPMLLPRPDSGYVRAELGNGAVVRGPSSGFADEARLTALVTGGAALETLGRTALEEAVAAAVASPPLDLRQGVFARRRHRGIDWALARRLALLAGAVLAVTLLIDLVRIARLEWDSAALETRADVVARSGLPRGAGEGDADRLLTERLGRLRGPGAGFTRTVATVFGAVRSAGGAEVTTLTFDPAGTLRVGLTAEGEAQANAVRDAVAATGLSVEASPFAASGGRMSGELTVRAP